MTDRHPIAFVANDSQWHALEVQEDLRGSCRMATGSFPVLVGTRKKDGVPVVDLWGYLEPRDMYAHYREAVRLCEVLGAAWQGRMVWRGFDVMAAIALDLLHPITAALCTSTAIGRLLDDQRPSLVVHFGEMARACFWDPPEPPPDVFNAMVAWQAEARGFPTRVLSAPPVGPTLNAAVQVPSMRASPLPATGGLLFVSTGYGYGEQSMLVDAVSGRSDLFHLFLQGVPTSSPFASLALICKAPFCLDPVREAGRRLLAEPGWGIPPELVRQYPSVFANPHMSFLWGGLMEWADRMMQHYGAAVLAARALRPSAAVLQYDVFGDMRCLAEGLTAEGVGVLAIDHVGLAVPEAAMRNKGAKPSVAVWGDYDESSMRQWGDSRMEVHKIGSLRPDLAGLPLSPKAMPVDATGAIGPVKVVVFTAQNNAGETLISWAWPPQLLRSWEALMDLVVRKPMWRFVVRTRCRYESQDSYRKLMERVRDRIEYSEGALEEALKGATVGVLMNTPSTVTIQTIGLGVPVVYLKDAVPPEAQTPLEDGGVVVVNSVGQLESEIERLAGEPDYRAKVLQAQHDFLRRAVSACGKEAGQRALGVLENIARAHPPSSPVDPAARWVLDVVALLDHAMWGFVDGCEFENGLRDLKRRGEGIDFAANGLLDPQSLGLYFLNQIAWYSWGADTGMFRPRAMMGVYRTLPSSIRPSLSLLRSRLVHAFLSEQSRPALTRRQRWLCRWMPSILAPGRIFRKAEA